MKSNKSRNSLNERSILSKFKVIDTNGINGQKLFYDIKDGVDWIKSHLFSIFISRL